MNKSTETARNASASQTARQAAENVDRNQLEIDSPFKKLVRKSGRKYVSRIQGDGGKLGYKFVSGPASGWTLVRKDKYSPYAIVDPDGKERDSGVTGLTMAEIEECIAAYPS